MTDEPRNEAAITVQIHQFQISSLISWIECNGYKPDVLVNTKYVGVKLPPQLLAHSQTKLNMHGDAITKVSWDDTQVSFNARFNQRDFRCVVPYMAMLGLNFRGTDSWVTLPWMGIPTPDSDDTPAPAQPAPAEESVVPTEEPQQEPSSTSNVRHVEFGSRRTPKK